MIEKPDRSYHIPSLWITIKSHRIPMKTPRTCAVTVTHTVAPGAQRAQRAQGAQGAARGSHWDTLAVRLTWKEVEMLGIWQQSMGILWGFYRISRGFYGI